MKWLIILSISVSGLFAHHVEKLFDVSEFDKLRSVYFETSLLIDKYEEELEQLEAGSYFSTALRQYVHSAKIFDAEINGTETGLFFSSKEDEEEFNQYILEYDDWNERAWIIQVVILPRLKEKANYYLEAYSYTQEEALGFFSFEEWFEAKNLLLLNALNQNIYIPPIYHWNYHYAEPLCKIWSCIIPHEGPEQIAHIQSENYIYFEVYNQSETGIDRGFSANPDDLDNVAKTNPN